ncbi:toxin-antitoxin system YwqK family antitoxin, partial [Dysgonomonas alginatilytica]
MKLKLTVSVICLFMLSLQLFAQRTITKRLCPSCRPYAQYQVNANGDYNGFFTSWDRHGRLAGTLNYQHGQLHGMCVTYFENGSINEQAEYYQGTQISLKIYAYEDGKRKLVRNATWDRSGNIITDGDNAGKLPNGRWRFNYPRYGDYSETYNGNDTLYIWDDRAKQRFLGKYLDGTRVYTKEETMIMKEQAIQDSISYVMELEEEERLYLIEEAKEQATQDSIKQVKIKYNNLVDSIIDT